MDYVNRVMTQEVEGTFATKEEARKWLDKQNLEFQDNNRFAFCDELDELTTYRDRLNHGCCGYFDAVVIVDGRKALIGCNYGH